MKLLKFGVIEEVSKSSLRCVNPLTVAQNTSKKCLCIDLLCCFNEQCDVQKFKIEVPLCKLWHRSILTITCSVLTKKLAYLQIPVNENFLAILGFCDSNSHCSGGNWASFLVQNVAFWVKMMRPEFSPSSWGAQLNISVFLHIDDGFSFANSREAVLWNSAAVRADLMALGLLISEEKCQWGACKCLEWTGFSWDTVRFQLSVTDRNIEKAAALVSELLCSTGLVAIRQVAGLVGLLGSFYLAMGPRSRFHSRGLMTFGRELQYWPISGARGHCNEFSRLSMMVWMAVPLIQAALLTHCDVFGLCLRWFCSAGSSSLSFQQSGEKKFLFLLFLHHNFSGGQ